MLFVPVMVALMALLFLFTQLVFAGYLFLIAGLLVFGLVLLASVKLTACSRDVSVLKLIAQVLAVASVYAVFCRVAPYVAAAISLVLPAAAAAAAELNWTERDRAVAQLLESYRGWLIVWCVVFAAALIVSFVVPGEGITRETLVLWQRDDGEAVIKIFFPMVTNWEEPGNFWAGCAAAASVCCAAVRYKSLERKAERERETARLVARARGQMQGETVRPLLREESVPVAAEVNRTKEKPERVCRVERKITVAGAAFESGGIQKGKVAHSRNSGSFHE